MLFEVEMQIDFSIWKAWIHQVFQNYFFTNFPSQGALAKTQTCSFPDQSTNSNA